jgi:histidyl-tRNA synthetase
VFPLKISYTTACFRNELVDHVDDLKRRQFTQFGLEVLGADQGLADLEAIQLLAAGLRELGVPTGSVRVRLGDVAVFNRLVALSGLGADAAITVKEVLDAVAECKAGKKPERRVALIADIRGILETHDLTPHWRQVWLSLAGRDDPVAVLEGLTDEVIDGRLSDLNSLALALHRLDVSAVVDPCVVRSHEYYTGLAFEIDVLAGGHAFVEVGGGGRYDRLVAHFIDGSALAAVPATGWAFGIERLTFLLDQLGLLGAERGTTPHVRLGASSADVLVVPGEDDPIGYVEANRVAVRHRQAGRSADVYVGEPAGWPAYAAARNITEYDLPVAIQEDTQ